MLPVILEQSCTKSEDWLSETPRILCVQWPKLNLISTNRFQNCGEKNVNGERPTSSCPKMAIKGYPYKKCGNEGLKIGACKDDHVW